MDNKKTSPPSKLGFKRGSWTAAEDKILLDYVAAHGAGKWGKASKTLGLNRCPRSCRNRWLNYLRQDIKRGNISEAEEDLIVRLHKLLGNRWSLIAGRLPGRTDNEIKNYWNTVLKKKLEVKSGTATATAMVTATATATAKYRSTTCSTEYLSEHDNRKECIEAVLINEDKRAEEKEKEERDVFEQLENLEIDQLWPRGVFDFEQDTGIWGGADSAVFFGDGFFM